MAEEMYGIEDPQPGGGVGLIRRPPQTLIAGAEGEENTLEKASKDLMIFDRLRNLAVALTKPRDWVAFPGGEAGERAWPTRSACNKLATATKISTGIHIDQNTGRRYSKTIDRDDRGEYYVIEVNGWVLMPGFRQFDVFGFCSSRHKLFASTGKRDDEGNIIFKPMTEVSLPNVIQAAYTNFQANAIMRMLGLDNMSAEEMEALLGGKITRVEYKSGRSEQTAEEKDEDAGRRKKLWAICLAMRGGSETEATTLLESMTKFTVQENGKDKEIPGVRDVARLKGKRLEYALRDADKRLSDWYTKNPERKADVESAIAKFAAA